MKITHTRVTASVNTGMSYWYKFRHGLGPGTMPKDCHILKVIDDGWKDYVLLDRMLTTQELNEYEIKEETPPVELLQENGYNSIEDTYEDVTSDTEVAEDEDTGFDARWDSTFGEPATEVFTPDEFDEWWKEVMDFE